MTSILLSLPFTKFVVQIYCTEFLLLDLYYLNIMLCYTRKYCLFPFLSSLCFIFLLFVIIGI